MKHRSLLIPRREITHSRLDRNVLLPVFGLLSLALLLGAGCTGNAKSAVAGKKEGADIVVAEPAQKTDPPAAVGTSGESETANPRAGETRAKVATTIDPIIPAVPLDTPCGKELARILDLHNSLPARFRGLPTAEVKKATLVTLECKALAEKFLDSCSDSPGVPVIEFTLARILNSLQQVAWQKFVKEQEGYDRQIAGAGSVHVEHPLATTRAWTRS